MRRSNRSAVSECVSQEVITGFPTCRDCTPDSEAEEFGVDNRHYCDGSSCFTRMKRPDYERRMLRLDGLHFPHIPRGVQVPSFERLVVSHDFDMKIPLKSSIFGSAVAVPYWRVGGLLSLSPERAMNFRLRNKLSEDQILILHGEGQDKNLERLFIKSCQPNFWETFASLHPVVLIAPGYSVYTDKTQCRHWQTYNLARSAQFFAEAVKYSLPCVPWIASNHKMDTVRICEWLNAYPQISHVAVNFQTKGVEALVENISFIKSIENATSQQLKWLIFGVSSAQSVRAVTSSIKGEITFVTGKPIQRARAGRDVCTQRKILTLDRDDLIESAILEQRNIIDTNYAPRHSAKSGHDKRS